jgi:hypothetical protein
VGQIVPMPLALPDKAHRQGGNRLLGLSQASRIGYHSIHELSDIAELCPNGEFLESQLLLLGGSVGDAIINDPQASVVGARFPAVKSLDSFDFAAIPSLNKTLVLELARSEYVARRGTSSRSATAAPARLTWPPD